jgi:hypothetical protein
MTTPQPIGWHVLGVMAAWAELTLRDWRFWVFLWLTTAGAWAGESAASLSPFFADTYGVLWLLASLPLCLQQASLLQAARTMGGGPPLWAFLAANALIICASLVLGVIATSPFPQTWLDAVRWWGLVLTVACLPISTVLRSLLVACMAWFGSTCATYSPLGVWIDIWPRPDRASMVSLFLAASWLALAACLALRKAPHEVRHSR